MPARRWSMKRARNGSNGTLSYQQPIAFPGAVGFGRFASGGRGGEVYRVTNLNASGAGSFHDAINSSSPDVPRTIVFAVKGTTETISAVYSGKGNLTIAGETAPGGGFCVKGDIRFNGGKNIIIRNVRFRCAPSATVLKWCVYFDGSGLPVSNVIIDHCTFSYHCDDALMFYLATDVTVQNCLIHEWSRKYTADSSAGQGCLFFDDCQRVTIYRNVMAHCPKRMPLVLGDKFQIAENVAFNQREYVQYILCGVNGKTQANTYAESVNNLRLLGAAETLTTDAENGALWYKIAGNCLDSGTGDNFVHVSGNYADVDFADAALTLVASTMHGTYTAWATSFSGVESGWPVITATTVSAAWLAARLADCYPVQGPDDAETLVINSVTTRATMSTATTSYLAVGTYSVYYPADPDVDSLAGYPDLTAGSTAAADSDSDGMPDSWETGLGLDPANAADRNETATLSGYTQLEVYLHGLNP